MPKVSVIVPVYNVERYLEQCVNSLLGQTLQDMEILLINDASTDQSLQLARRFLKDSRVRVLDKPHGGLGDTRNWGVREASGEYLAFVDSDDWLEPNALEELTAAADEDQADLVLFHFVRENMEDGERRVCRLPLSCPARGEETARIILRELVGPGPDSGPWRGAEMLGCAWRRLYRRDWFVEHGLSYPNEQQVMLEDLPVSIQAHVLPGVCWWWRGLITITGTTPTPSAPGTGRGRWRCCWPATRWWRIFWPPRAWRGSSASATWPAAAQRGPQRPGELLFPQQPGRLFRPLAGGAGHSAAALGAGGRPLPLPEAGHKGGPPGAGGDPLRVYAAGVRLLLPVRRFAAEKCGEKVTGGRDGKEESAVCEFQPAQRRH